MDPVPFARVLGLEALLAGQDGVIRRDQALATGMTKTRIDDLVRRRKWTAVLPRVYLTGPTQMSTKIRLRACWLWAGDQSVIAESAAAWLWGIAKEPPSIITVIIPLACRRTPQTGIRVVRGMVHPRDADFQDWIGVTTVARTCLDLARAGLPDNLENALRLRRANVPKLELSLERGRGRRGQVRARQAFDEASTNPWSVAERKAHQQLIAAGITGWTANPPVRLTIGIRHPDIAIEAIKLAIEIDGREFHTKEENFENDHVRRKAFVRAGWTVLEFTVREITEDPELMIEIIKETEARLRRQQHPAPE